MRKLLCALAFLGICGVSTAQITDNAVIPISVTINSVLRLQVTSGGNIQFAFNTMSQFTGGIVNTTKTTTTFNVASSRPYVVEMAAEDEHLIGISTGTTKELGLITYTTKGTGDATETITGSDTPLTQAPASIIVNTVAISNGVYSIKWAAGTGTIKATNTPPDTYVTNVYLTLSPN